MYQIDFFFFIHNNNERSHSGGLGQAGSLNKMKKSRNITFFMVL